MSITIDSIWRDTPQVPPFPIYRISVQKYHEMIEKEVLTEDDPVELLEGWIVHKMPRFPLHDGTIQRAQRAIAQALPAEWMIRVQSAVTLEDSEPEPDLAIVHSLQSDYTDHHPYPENIGILIEVNDSSLESDRVDKGRVYARAGIAVYWIVNLASRQIEVYADPDPRAKPPIYRNSTIYSPNQSVPIVLQGQVIAKLPVNGLLP